MHRLLERACQDSVTIILFKRPTLALKATKALIGNRIENVIRKSFLYRWLTKEPELEIVVIDPMESLTLRPVFFLIHHIGSGLKQHLRTSSFWRAVDNIALILKRGIDTSLVKKIIHYF